MSEEYKDKQKLKELYWEKGMTQKEIGEKYGVNRKTIQYWQRKFGIETRTPRSKRPGSFDFNEGYARFRTTVDGKLEQVLIHRLVAVAEYGFNPLKDKIVHHKNGVKWDNRPENLELMSHGEHTTKHNNEREFCIGEYKKQQAGVEES